MNVGKEERPKEVKLLHEREGHDLQREVHHRKREQLAFEAARTGLSTVGASYHLIKKMIWNDGMHLSMNKVILNKFDHNDKICVS